MRGFKLKQGEIGEVRSRCILGSRPRPPKKLEVQGLLQVPKKKGKRRSCLTREGSPSYSIWGGQATFQKIGKNVHTENITNLR